MVDPDGGPQTVKLAMEGSVYSDAAYEPNEQPTTYPKPIECLKYVQRKQAVNPN